MKILKEKVQLKKILWIIRILYSLQIITLILAMGYLIVQIGIIKEEPGILSYIILLIPMVTIILINGYFIVTDSTIFNGLNKRLVLQEESYENIEQLNRDLRSQRHDFLNHIQILYSLMEMGEHVETTHYLNRLYGDIGKLSANIKTQSVAVNALLQVKSNEADNLGIKYTVKISTRLEHMNMHDWELCRVLSNIIDNGFEGTIKMDENRYVDISIKEHIKAYEIIIKNSSINIPYDLRRRLFEAGVTTKSNPKEHGMGLYITSQLMHKYNNTISMNYSDGIVEVGLKIGKMTIEA